MYVLKTHSLTQGSVFTIGFVHICVFVWGGMCVHVYMHAYMWWYVSVCVPSMWWYVCTICSYVCICVWWCVCVHVCTHVCVHVFVNVHVKVTVRGLGSLLSPCKFWYPTQVTIAFIHWEIYPSLLNFKIRLISFEIESSVAQAGLNILYVRGWLWTLNPPASTFWALAGEVCTTMLGLSCTTVRIKGFAHAWRSLWARRCHPSPSLATFLLFYMPLFSFYS